MIFPEKKNDNFFIFIKKTYKNFCIIFSVQKTRSQNFKIIIKHQNVVSKTTPLVWFLFDKTMLQYWRLIETKTVAETSVSKIRNATTRSKRQHALEDNSQYAHHRSRANILWACQQRVGLHTKSRTGYRAKNIIL